MKYLIAALVASTYVAGYLHGIRWEVSAYALGFTSVALLGLLVNRAIEGSTFRVVESATEHPLELGALTDQLEVNKLMPLYVQAGGYKPVLGAFICRLANQRAIVLEVD